MKVAYFRKSTVSFDETVKNAEAAIKKQGWELNGKSEQKNGVIFHINSPKEFEALSSMHKEFIGFIPTTLSVIKEGKDVMVGTIDMGILKGMTHGHNHGEAEFIEKLENDTKEMIHSAANVGEQKMKSLRLFATKTCRYCTLEKEWLDEKGVEYETSFVDSDQEMAQYMVQSTGQMGVPVTEVIFEDGDSEFVVGFDKERLSQFVDAKNN